MTLEKPSKNEDEYFARQDMELLEKQRRAARAAQEEADRRSHYMKCPKDGFDLVTETSHGVEIDTCPHCGGVWLDRGELEAIEEHHDRPGLLSRLVADLLSGWGGSRRRAAPRPADEPTGPHG
jgi:hypothetical protein